MLLLQFAKNICGGRLCILCCVVADHDDNDDDDDDDDDDDGDDDDNDDDDDDDDDDGDDDGDDDVAVAVAVVGECGIWLLNDEFKEVEANEKLKHGNKQMTSFQGEDEEN